jgi:hypothetical protein
MEEPDSNHVFRPTMLHSSPASWWRGEILRMWAGSSNICSSGVYSCHERAAACRAATRRHLSSARISELSASHISNTYAPGAPGAPDAPGAPSWSRPEYASAFPK